MSETRFYHAAPIHGQQTATDGLLIILATYNELGNLPTLLEALRREFPSASILIVDDDSPDGTPDWCDQRRRIDPLLEVHIRYGQRGLGSAARLGLRRGLHQNFSWLATMDADWSHHPQDLRRLLTAAKTSTESENIGVWIGSRYVAGGAISDWSWWRRVASRWVNRWGRKRLGVPVNDISSALRLYRADALRQIDWNELRQTGYGYLEELLCQLYRAGFQLREVPITFGPRRAGRSKLRWRDIWEVVYQLVFPRRG